MTKQVKHRRGTHIEHQTFTGAQAEITIDTTNNALVVHDGVNPGGHNVLLQSIARPLNISDSEVIYSTDTVTAIPIYIYDASAQVT